MRAEGIRRPFGVLTALGTAGHHGFEYRAGVGLVFEPFLGRRRALALWWTLLPFGALTAAFGGRRHDKPLAFQAGAALAGGLIHYLEWPWEWRRGVPTLVEAEGLRPEQVPAYDAVLKFWLAASALAVGRETAPGAWPFALAGLLSGVPLRASARHHFAWAREQALREPEKWSPVLREKALQERAA
jgi:hypothetical protein